MRLVGGLTNREGRVEVCLDGRWGTVCGEGWGDTEAGLVCSTMGFPAQSKHISQTIHTIATYIPLLLTDSTMYQFGGHLVQPIYNLTCSSSESDLPNCTVTLAPDSCDHSMDLGVRCLSHHEVASKSNSISNESTPLVCSPTLATVSCNCSADGIVRSSLDIVTPSEEAQSKGCLMRDGGPNEVAVILGVITPIGLLVVVLTLVFVGLAVMYFVRKNKRR